MITILKNLIARLGAWTQGETSAMNLQTANCKLEQWNIETYGLRVGGKLWAGDSGWFVIERMSPGSVWVRPLHETPSDKSQ